MPESQQKTGTMPEKAIVETIRESDLSRLSIDFGEVALDSLFDDGLLNDIPIIRTIVGLAKTGLAIKDYIFLKKVSRFLYHLEDIPAEERQEFIDKHDTEKQGQQIGESLILLLDRYDHFDKVNLMAQLFKMYVKEEINFNEFLRYSTIIDRILMEDLNHLLNYFSGEKVKTKTLWESLYKAGLAQMVIPIEVDNSLGFNLLITKSPTPDEFPIYTYNSEAVRFAEPILEDDFVHPKGLVWDSTFKMWKPSRL